MVATCVSLIQEDALNSKDDMSQIRGEVTKLGQSGVTSLPLRFFVATSRNVCCKIHMEAISCCTPESSVMLSLAFVIFVKSMIGTLCPSHNPKSQ